MSTSTVYASKIRLLDILNASPDLGAANPPVPVWWGRPNWDHGQSENVYIDAADDTLDWASLGARNRDENYTINLRVEVYLSGTDGQKTEARLWGIEQAIETALLADVTLGGTVLDARIARINQTLEPAGDGYLAAADVSVAVHARV